MKRFIKSLLYILVGIFIFVVLPLLAWNIHYLDTFFNDSIRKIYVVIIAALQVFAIIYNPEVTKEKENKNNLMPQSKIDLFLIQIFSLLIVVSAPYSDSHSIGAFNCGDFVRYVGLVFVLFGFFLMQFAEKKLNRQFSMKVTIQENHQLVKTGPYRIIRHPRYLGILVFFTGISFVFRSYLAMGITFMLLLVLVWRIRAEESLLKKQFKKEWDNYCAETWRMIPYLF